MILLAGDVNGRLESSNVSYQGRSKSFAIHYLN